MSKRVHLYFDLEPYQYAWNILCQDEFVEYGETSNWTVTGDSRRVTCRKCRALDAKLIAEMNYSSALDTPAEDTPNKGEV